METLGGREGREGGRGGREGGEGEPATWILGEDYTPLGSRCVLLTWSVIPVLRLKDLEGERQREREREKEREREREREKDCYTLTFTSCSSTESCDSHMTALRVS